MRSVCICGSFRFYDEMVELRQALASRGIACDWPLPGPRQAPSAMTADEALEAITRHLERLDRANVIVVVNPDGQTGASVAMEIGYARAQRKPIYALAPVSDPFLGPLITAVVSTADLMHLVGDGAMNPLGDGAENSAG